MNDAVVEGTHTGTITHSSSGSGYAGVSIADVVANITDDDSPSVIVAQSSGSTSLTESGVTDSYTVVLGLEPSGTVTVSMSADSQVSLSATSLEFTTGNWDTAQTVVLTAVNDAVVEGAQTSTITHSASSGNYDGVSISDVVASITDNDTASVTISESGGSTDVTEGGASDSYTVVLDLQPSGTVTITISPDSEVSLSTTTLTFTTGNWDTAQTVTVTAVDDAVVEGDHTGTVTHSASGGSYDGVSISNVVANVTDNDSAGGDVLEQLEYRWFTNADSVSPGSALAAQDTALTDAVEGTPYHLRMSIEDSVVDLAAGEVFKLQYAATTTGPWTDVGAPASGTTWRGYDNPSVADGTTLSTNQLTSATILETYEESNSTASTPVKIDVFKSGEWAWVVQPNDTLASTSYYFRMVRGNGAVLETYTTYPQVTMVARSVTITESSGSTDVTEGGPTDAYNVVLDAQPSATVTLTISPDSQVTVSTSTLTFTTSNWNTPQTTTVTAVDDTPVEAAHTGTFTHSASGGGYSGASIANVVANITDNDPGSVTVTESAASTEVTEGGATDTYTVVLDAEPSGTVTVTPSPDADGSVNPTSLTFTTSNFGTPQTVTVTAVDDAFVEGFHTSTITHSASGGGYDGVSIADVVATVTVTETSGSTDVTEGGATDTYDVVIDPQPSGTVTITISHDSQVSLSTTTLTFTTSNWETPQNLTVTADDDAVDEGLHTSTITHSASGGGFDGVSIPDVAGNIDSLVKTRFEEVPAI